MKNRKANYRKAIIEDLDIIYGFERAYIMAHEPENLVQWDGISAKTLQSLSRNMNRMFVAIMDGTVVGHAYWQLQENTPWVYSIYVMPETRGEGLGKTLLTLIEKDIVSKGYTCVLLSTLQSNPAQYLFEKRQYHKDKSDNGWLYYSKSLE